MNNTPQSFFMLRTNMSLENWWVFSTSHSLISPNEWNVTKVNQPGEAVRSTVQCWCQPRQCCWYPSPGWQALPCSAQTGVCLCAFVHVLVCVGGRGCVHLNACVFLHTCVFVGVNIYSWQWAHIFMGAHCHWIIWSKLLRRWWPRLLQRRKGTWPARNSTARWKRTQACWSNCFPCKLKNAFLALGKSDQVF